MNTRQIEILILIKDCYDAVMITDLADLFKVSIRTIQNDIKIISSELEKRSIQLKRDDKNGIYIDKSLENDKALNALTYDFDVYDNILTPEERNQLLLNILLLHQGYLAINSLANMMNVSRGTILSDINRLRARLEDNGMIIIASSRYGIKLNGDEKAIREFVVGNYLDNCQNQSIQNVEQYHMSSLCNRYIKTRSLAESTLIFDLLQKLMVTLNSYFSGRSFISIISYLELAVERSRLGKCINLSSLQKESVYGTKEFKLIHQLFNELSDKLGIVFPVDELCYLTLKVFLAGYVATTNSEDEDNYAEIQIIVCTLIDKVANHLNVEVNYDKPLYNNLVYHIKPAIYRIKNNIYQSNPLINEIKENYKDIFEAVKANIGFIENMIGSRISDDEIAYIAIHFLTYLERDQGVEKKKHNILVVCDSGIGTSNLLTSRLMALYDVNIVDTIALYQLQETLEKHDVDCIISTIDFNIYRKEIPVIKVTPFINEQDTIKLNEIIKIKKQKVKIDAESFINELNKFGVIKDKHNLIASLKKHFSIEFINEDKEGKILMLKDVISLKMIEVGYKAKDWEDAVREAGKLLMVDGCVNQDYIDSMVSTVKRVGTYIVISKGIALPHSRSGDGAFKVGISVLKLAEPVVFGHPENDPVDLVFGLSSVDNSSHITALQDLASTLVDQTKVDYLRNENDPEKLFAFLAKENN
ncbi:MAG: BglG family transcription antiterminator [Erysipelotrichaceae bacterium]|nr:BglG family transcription antiterminator [Erysipelotrichaceae bacterium]MDD3924314.1 BglG family transcription antiterminator [Erysipelotrichaceae bacterium]MDD4642250.1 BglG family transcription antiterminator [Erysipelotrichaceae bacterium]